MNLSDLDVEFSKLIRHRDKWKCQACGQRSPVGTAFLHCAHFHSRRLKSVRWDPENADALCWGCHWRMDRHPAQHRAWKLARLGADRYEALAWRARMVVKPDREAIRRTLDGLRESLPKPQGLAETVSPARETRSNM